LDLHSTSRGIVTVNNMTTRSPLVQGAFRFREADLRQKITFLAKDVKQTTKELIEGIDRRENELFNRSEIKFHQQTILCLLRQYDSYSKKSYQLKTFTPSVEMSDDIFIEGKYTHDYKKEQFTKYVMDFIADVDKKYLKNTNNVKSDGMSESIKTEIFTNLKKVNDSNVEDNSIMVQKQTNVQKEKNYQSETEANNNRGQFNNNNVSFEKICTYDIDLKPTSFNINIKFDAAIEADDMMKQLKIYNIHMSPNAAYAIAKTYYYGETNDVFYLKFVGEGDATKVMLYTSLDTIILYSYNEHILDDLIKIDKFEINTDTKKSFYQNFIRFLLLKIPNSKSMDYFEHNEAIKSIAPIIGSHYRYAFKYNIASISKRFSNFIGLK